MIGIVATLKAQPGKGAELYKALQSLATVVLEKEKGCHQYEPFVTSDAPDTIVVIEQYEDAAASQEHRDSAHYQSAVATLSVLLAAAP